MIGSRGAFPVSLGNGKIRRWIVARVELIMLNSLWRLVAQDVLLSMKQVPQELGCREYEKDCISAPQTARAQSQAPIARISS